MPTSEILGMIGQALRAMLIGVSGVFAVLAVFFGAIKLIVKVGDKHTEEE